MNIAQVAEWAQRQPWAITESYLSNVIAQAIMAKARGEAMPEIEAAAPQRSQKGAIAVIPIYGPTTKKPSMLAQLFGINLPTYDGTAAVVNMAVADPNVGTILLDIDSPGGVVNGCDELSTVIFNARSQKRIVAYTGGTMASAAYYYGSAAHEVIASADADVGSIGCIAIHLDMSEMAKMEGVKPTIVTSAPKKAEFHPLEPLSDDAKARAQAVVDHAGGMFVKAVARNRGVSVDVVRKQYGEGRLLMAHEAKAAGMVDRIDTMEGTLRRLGGQSMDVGRPLRAIAEIIGIQASVEPLADGGEAVESTVDDRERRRRKIALS